MPAQGTYGDRTNMEQEELLFHSSYYSDNGGLHQTAF